MKLLIATALIFSAISVIFTKSIPNFMNDEFIDSINRAQSSWKAGRDYDMHRWYASTRPPGSYLEALRSMLATTEEEKEDPVGEIEIRNYNSTELENLPENFDAREQWPECKSLWHIRDQTGCGSCWAVSGASAMTDRLCIKSGGNITKSISAGDIIACSKGWASAGCEGGSIYAPWYYWKKHGIASGGDYGSEEGCVNYQFPSCKSVSSSKKPSCQIVYTPQCIKECSSTNLTYTNELTYGKNVYRLPSEEAIMKDILEHGPLVGGFKVYEDFETYKSGVYHHIKGEFRYGHAVKILGWGVENGEKYWLCANSWNEEWGENGFFRIKRGADTAGIKIAYAGEPLI